MKNIEKQKALELRRNGYSFGEITQELGVAKSSVSLWVRDIKLTKEQKLLLRSKHNNSEVIERRRATRLKNERIKREAIIIEAQRTVTNLTLKELFIAGVMLYWAEGGKTQSVVRFSNGDPEMIKIMMVFFKKICRVPQEKFHGYIHIHPHLDNKLAEVYWSKVSGIGLEKFYKTYRKVNPSSKNKRKSLPYGTFDIYICRALYNALFLY